MESRSHHIPHLRRRRQPMTRRGKDTRRPDRCGSQAGRRCRAAAPRPTGKPGAASVENGVQGATPESFTRAWMNRFVVERGARWLEPTVQDRPLLGPPGHAPRAAGQPARASPPPEPSKPLARGGENHCPSYTGWHTVRSTPQGGNAAPFLEDFPLLEPSLSLRAPHRVR